MKDYATQSVGRVGRVTAIVGVLIVVTALTAAVVVGIRLFSSDEYTITAQFPATPGLYHDNDVDILGVPSGHVVKVTPKAKYVEVVLTLPSNVKIPADAKAVVMAPNPVSDRFIELTPPYTKGPKLKAGAVLGLDRTVVPLEIDQVFASLSTISRQLGPSGANKNGALSAALHAFAGLADGNGQHLHDAIGKIAAALPALTAHPDDLRRLIDGLDSLTTKLVSRNDTINHLYDDLAKTTGQFADDRAVLSSAISNLQRGLAQVAVFIKANQSRLGTAVKGLNVTMAAILSQQKSLIQTFDIAPLGFQNFNRAIDPNTPCPSATGAPHNCSALWARLNTTSDAWPFVTQYCGSNILQPLVPIVKANLGLGKASATDTACGAQIGLLSNRQGPPGSPKGPDLDLAHYLRNR